MKRFVEIEEGRGVGFVRPDIDDSGRTLFIFEPPWMIAYSPETCQVLRIAHGAQDLPFVLRSL